MIKIKFSHKKCGFSLVELSIVILVIGVLVVGITKGKRIISQSKLTSAQSLTRSSGVSSMDGLVLWLDATNENNLKTSTFATIATTSYGNIKDGNLISAWRGSNPSITGHLQLTAPSDAYRPLYLISGMNGLPALKFDGTDQLSNNQFQAPISPGDPSYTFIVVWKEDIVSSGMILSQRSDTSYQGAEIYTTSNHLLFYGEPSSVNVISNAIKVGVPYITILQVNNDNVQNITYFHNSNTSYSGTSSNSSLLNISNKYFIVGARIYSSNTNSSKVTISEVLAFNRNLTRSEIQSINSYLSQKYSISVN